MHRAMFAERIIVADDDPAQLLGHPRVLRIAADDGPFEDSIALAQLRAVFHHHAAGQFAAIADFDVRLDDGERADNHVASELGLGADNRLRMDLHRRYPSWAGGKPGYRCGCRPEFGPSRGHGEECVFRQGLLCRFQASVAAQSAGVSGPIDRHGSQITLRLCATRSRPGGKVRSVGCYRLHRGKQFSSKCRF